MKARLGLLAALAACATPPPSADPLLPGLSLRHNDTTLQITMVHDRTVQPLLSAPKVEGVQLGPPKQVTEPVGALAITTFTFPFSAREGEYIVEGVCAELLPGAAPACATPLFVTVGEPAAPLELADIQDPRPVFTVPWIPLSVAGMLAFGGVWLYRRRGQQALDVDVPPPPPPHTFALERLATLRAQSKGPLEHAEVLSSICRDYLAEVLAFPANAWSTTETLAYLGGLQHFPDAQKEQAKVLLRATDRVKYAGAGAEEQTLRSLEGSLEGLIDATKPASFSETHDEGAP